MSKELMDSKEPDVGYLMAEKEEKELTVAEKVALLKKQKEEAQKSQAPASSPVAEQPKTETKEEVKKLREQAAKATE